MLVLLPDGRHLLQFAEMLRKDSQCYTFVVEQTHFLCPGHQKWDPKKPGQNLEAIEKWDAYHAEKDKKTKEERVSPKQ